MPLNFKLVEKEWGGEEKVWELRLRVVVLNWDDFALQVGLPDLASKNTGHSAQFEFQVNNE